MADRTPATRDDLDQNVLLASLSPAVKRRLASVMTLVPFPERRVVHPAGAAVREVYFPTAGMFSMVATLESGGTVELASVGREGVLGLPAVLGDRQPPFEVLCQITGSALRIDAGAFRVEVARNTRLDAKLRRYTQALFTMAAQGAACNRAHRIGRRLARWLLQVHDQVGADQFRLTQEFLGQMLGVRRSGVTEAAHALLLDGVIAYRRGVVTVNDRRALELAACECYGAIRSEFARLLDDGRRSAPPAG